MSRDVVADLLTCIRNASLVGKRSVVVPHSNFRAEITRVLKEEGYISNFTVVAQEAPKKNLEITLKYYNGSPVISEIKLISKQGRRCYKSAKDIKAGFKGGMGIFILSTSRGVMSNVQAKTYSQDGNVMSLGGEVLCSVW